MHTSEKSSALLGLNMLWQLPEKAIYPLIVISFSKGKMYSRFRCCQSDQNKVCENMSLFILTISSFELYRKTIRVILISDFSNQKITLGLLQGQISEPCNLVCTVPKLWPFPAIIFFEVYYPKFQNCIYNCMYMIWAIYYAHNILEIWESVVTVMT